eukprot:12229340-Alexandrium_andersonii.AAC.1
MPQAGGFAPHTAAWRPAMPAPPGGFAPRRTVRVQWAEPSRGSGAAGGGGPWLGPPGSTSVVRRA